MNRSRAIEIVKGRCATKEERESYKYPEVKGWLKEMRMQLVEEFGITDADVSRKGPAIIDGIIMRGACAGKTLSEATDATLSGFNGVLKGAELKQVRAEMKRRSWKGKGHVSDKAIRTCIDRGMTPREIVDWFGTKGMLVTLTQVAIAVE